MVHGMTRLSQKYRSLSFTKLMAYKTRNFTTWVNYIQIHGQYTSNKKVNFYKHLENLMPILFEIFNEKSNYTPIKNEIALQIIEKTTNFDRNFIIKAINLLKSNGVLSNLDDDVWIKPEIYKQYLWEKLQKEAIRTVF